jgi:hypothetical protein
VIDDWAMAPLAEPERRDLREICEDRYQVRSLILTPQLPATRWHEQTGDPTEADGILDRWFTTPTVSRCDATRCARIAGSYRATGEGPRWRRLSSLSRIGRLWETDFVAECTSLRKYSFILRTIS